PPPKQTPPTHPARTPRSHGLVPLAHAEGHLASSRPCAGTGSPRGGRARPGPRPGVALPPKPNGETGHAPFELDELADVDLGHRVAPVAEHLRRPWRVGRHEHAVATQQHYVGPRLLGH